MILIVVVVLSKLLEFGSNVLKSSKIELVSTFQRLSNLAEFSKMSTNKNFWKKWNYCDVHIIGEKQILKLNKNISVMAQVTQTSTRFYVGITEVEISVKMCPKTWIFKKYWYCTTLHTYLLVTARSSGILKAMQKLGVTFNSDKLGGIDFTKFS